MSGSNYADDQGRIWQTWVSGAVAVLLGAAVMIAIYGLAPLDPRYQGWLYQGWPRGGTPDPLQFWLGWTYFRHSPWMMPPGANPDFGMELGTAIYFADAVPLLAMPLKAMRGVLDVRNMLAPGCSPVVRCKACLDGAWSRWRPAIRSRVPAVPGSWHCNPC